MALQNFWVLALLCLFVKILHIRSLHAWMAARFLHVSSREITLFGVWLLLH